MTKPYNIHLRLAIVESRIPQKAIAERLGIQESRLSRIISREYASTEDERNKLAQMLNRSVEFLFPEQAWEEEGKPC